MNKINKEVINTDQPQELAPELKNVSADVQTKANNDSNADRPKRGKASHPVPKHQGLIAVELANIFLRGLTTAVINNKTTFPLIIKEYNTKRMGTCCCIASALESLPFKKGKVKPVIHHTKERHSIDGTVLVNARTKQIYADIQNKMWSIYRWFKRSYKCEIPNPWISADDYDLRLCNPFSAAVIIDRVDRLTEYIYDQRHPQIPKYSFEAVVHKNYDGWEKKIIEYSNIEKEKDKIKTQLDIARILKLPINTEKQINSSCSTVSRFLAYLAAKIREERLIASRYPLIECPLRKIFSRKNSKFAKSASICDKDGFVC